MRPAMLSFMIASLGITVLFMSLDTTAVEAQEQESVDTRPAFSSPQQVEAESSAVVGSNDKPSTESTEVTRTLGEGDWLRFQDLSLQLMIVNENERDNSLDDSVELYLSLPEKTQIVEVKELHFLQFGLYEIFVRRAVPSDATTRASATIRVRYRSFYIPRYRLTPTPLPPATWPEKPRPPVQPQLAAEYRNILTITRWLRVGDDLRFRDLVLRLARVYENNPNDKRDDSVRLIVRTPISSRDFSIREFHSEFIDDYEIAVVEVDPAGRPGYGKARIQIRYRKP